MHVYGKKLGEFLKQPSTIKGIFALAAGIHIYTRPDLAAETVGAWLTLYGIYQAGRNEDKNVQ